MSRIKYNQGGKNSILGNFKTLKKLKKVQVSGRMYHAHDRKN